MTLLILHLDIKIFSYLCSCPKKSGKKKNPENENSVFWVSYLVFKET